MKQAILLTIYGHVQGVGFRFFIKQKADMLGISGYVRNQLNRTVYVEAEGEPEQLEFFTNLCRQEPSHVRVEKVEIQSCPLQFFEGFIMK